MKEESVSRAEKMVKRFMSGDRRSYDLYGKVLRLIFVVVLSEQAEMVETGV